MKKLIISFIVFFVSIPLYAQNTNYSSVQECINDVAGYASKASSGNQTNLSNWFNSFANDSQMKVNYDNATVTFYSGCHFIDSKDASKVLWIKMKEKLNQQINQQNSGQESLYGDKATLICKYSDATHRIDLDSCK